MTQPSPVSAHRVVHVRPEVEKALGYAQARRIGDDIYIAGVASQDAAFELLHPGDMGAQVGEVYRTIAAILAREGFSLQDIVEERVFVTDMAGFVAANKVRTEILAGALPATTVVAVTGLVVPGLMIEVSCFARRRASSGARL
jgi:enamine deaminase RidA (YjgF/YER057c/UK114 family)